MTQPTIILSPRKFAISNEGGVLEVSVRVQAADRPRDEATFAAAQPDAAVEDRLQVVEFAQASHSLRVLVQQGDMRAARARS